MSLFIVSLCFAAPLCAQTSETERLQSIQREQQQQEARQAELEQKRQAISKDIETLKSNLVRLAAEAEGYERTSRTTSERLSALKRKEARLREAVYGDRQALQQLLGALQRIETNPPPIVFVSPQNAADAVRAGKVISVVSVNLKSHADEISHQIQDLNTVRQSIEKQREELAKSEKNLSSKMSDIENLVDKKTQMEHSVSKERTAVIRRMNELAEEASNLQDLIRQVERKADDISPRLKPNGSEASRSNELPYPRLKPKAGDRPTPLTLPPDTARFADARGFVRVPVRGTVEKSYTSSHKGLSVASRRGAQVVAPYAGRVEFAGPYKYYDKVVIMNTGGGYFVVLTGLGELFVESGEMLQAGEPIGLMPIHSNSTQNLYIEVRKDGAPVNPAPWFGTAYANQG